jgi:preprotein translocase subunit SecG
VLKTREHPGKQGRTTVETAISIAMILLSIMLISVILLQTKGSSFSGAFGGGSDSINRTRRGVEKSLFQFTIILAVCFVAMAIVTSLVL